MKRYADRKNGGKIDYTLVPVDALTEEAKVWMAGEAKYGRANWQKLWGDDTVESVMGSLLRHAYAILEGEVLDKETGCQHAAHIRANAAMLIRHFNSFSSSPETVHPSNDQTTDQASTAPARPVPRY